MNDRNDDRQTERDRHDQDRRDDDRDSDDRDSDRDDRGGGHGPKRVEIIVNTRRHPFPKDEITYEEVTRLAFPTAPAGSDGYTVTYQRGHGGKDGSLVPGGRVKVKDGMVFDVTATHLS